MKIIYTTDLHGDTDKYRQLEEVTFDFGADVVVNGGDLLPHGDAAAQKLFITTDLAPHVCKFNDHSIHYLAQLGNDDRRVCDRPFDALCRNIKYTHNLEQRCVTINNEIDFIGMNYVVDYPFRLKDRCQLDKAGDEIGLQYGTGLLSMDNESEYYEIDDWARYISNLRSIEDDLKLLPKPERDAIYVFHQPPSKIGLDVCYGDRKVGSDAVREFLMAEDAKYSLHGHIHESPVMSGIWKARLGNTECIQPGQLTGLTYVTIDTESGNIDRRITTR